MKYGEQLEQESVPEWSLHNLDYNSLKHEIKVHTTRDQAAAIAIPGHQDTSLRKFEDGLYQELCRQHDRVGLFVTSKADEISRRLEHISSAIIRRVGKAPQDRDLGASLKRQRRFAKYERELLRCGNDIQALSRFSNAQVVAFRKILKKYKKWTGSTTLGSRFSDSVLSHPKSFNRRDFSGLQLRYDGIMADLRAVTPEMSEPSSPSSVEQPTSPSSRRRPRLQYEPLPPSQMDSQVKYWNEYDNGSEAGGHEDDYAIYIDPDEGLSFPGMGYINAILAVSFEKAKQWFTTPSSNEHAPLLSANGPSSGYSATAIHTEDSEEDGYASSSDFPSQGYLTHYALPSVGEQRAIRYRERVLFWGTIGGFVASFILLGIAGILITTGRHKLRIEVDAGVTVGAVASLFCACSALGMMMYRRDELSLLYTLAVWSTFIAASFLDGMLLVLVVGNAP